MPDAEAAASMAIERAHKAGVPAMAPGLCVREFVHAVGIGVILASSVDDVRRLASSVGPMLTRVGHALAI